MKLDGKVVWLTGASSGIGEALAYELAKKGTKLILSSRREDELKRVASSLGISDTDYMVLPMDLSSSSDFHSLVDQAISRYGRVDVLLNNGGISQRSLAIETPVSVDRQLFEVNFFGTVTLTKAILPHFIKNKSGTIATVTSAVGKFGSPWRSGYAAAKHALHGFFDSLRAEIYSSNVNILLICPGFVQTDVSKNALTASGEKLGSMDQATSDGLTAKECASRIVRAIEQEKEEVFIGGFKENLGLYVKRFFPSLFSIMIRKMAVR